MKFPPYARFPVVCCQTIRQRKAVRWLHGGQGQWTWLAAVSLLLTIGLIPTSQAADAAPPVSPAQPVPQADAVVHVGQTVQVGTPKVALPQSGSAEITLGHAVSLSEVLLLADQFNPTLQAAQGNIPISQADVRIAGERPNPLVFGLWGYGRTTTVMGNPQQFAMSYNLETGGKRKRRIQVANAQQLLTVEQVEALRWDIRNQTRQAYTELAIAEANGKLLDAQVNLMQQLVDIATKRFQAGVAPEAEVLQAKLIRDGLETQRTTMESRVNQARTHLGALVGSDLPAGFQISDNLLEIHVLRTDLLPGADQDLPPLDKLSALAYLRRPDLKVAQLQKSVAQNQIGLERARRIPDLLVSSGGQFISLPGKYAPDGKGGFFGGGYSTVSMSLPVFHNQQAEIAKAVAQRNQADKQILDVQNHIREDIQVSYQALQGNLENIHRYRTQLMPASADVLKLAQTSYRYGKTNLAAVILAQQADQQIRQGYLDSISDYQRNWASLEKAVGEPITP